jgi:molecular chaperone HscB
MFENVFKEFNLEPAFLLDEKKLEQRYFALQTEYHPDRFIGQTPEAIEHAHAKAARINEAYVLLKNPATRARCLLAALHIAPPNIADPELLMEIMLLREQLATVQPAEERQALLLEVKQQYAEACSTFAQAFTDKSQTLTKAYLRLNYLAKVLQDIRDKPSSDPILYGSSYRMSGGKESGKL